MKLKYYLRGLGIGMIVTALLMGYSNKTHAADAYETVAEAEESTEETALGGVLADRNATVQTETATETESVAEAMTETETETVTTEPIIIRDEQPVIAETTEEAAAEETTLESGSTMDDSSSVDETSSIGESITLTIARGDDSGTVSRKLQTAGLISDASEFDAYLMQHGYDKKISIGTVEIPVGSTWVEIAEIISGK